MDHQKAVQRPKRRGERMKKAEKKDLEVYEPRRKGTYRQRRQKPADRPSWHPEMLDTFESSNYYDEPELSQEEIRLIRRINDAS